MPRNSAGTYTLPAGNPVVAGTTIDASWANDTMSDMANELTNSLSRTGAGGMLAPFRVADGSVTAPGLGFTNETNTGLYRAGTGELWFTVGGVAVAQITANGLLIPSGKRISLPAPVNDADAANKEYVDDLVNPVIQYANYYLGPKSSDPSVNNSGGALTAGTTYWSTTLNQLRVYNGTTWEPMPSTASVQGQTFSGTGAQTAFTLAAPTGNATNLEVFISGVRQVPTADYTVSGTTLTFTSAPPSGTDNIYVRFAQLLALASADSSNISFLPAGTGAVTRTAQAKMRDVVSVKDFGAVGDGVADDTAAIQAAAATLGVTSNVLTFPAGTYKLTGTITVSSKNSFSITGTGRINQTVANTPSLKFMSCTDFSVSGLYLYGLGTDYVPAADTSLGIGIWCESSSRFSISKNTFRNFGYAAIYSNGGCADFDVSDNKVRGTDGITSAITGGDFYQFGVILKSGTSLASPNTDFSVSGNEIQKVAVGIRTEPGSTRFSLRGNGLTNVMGVHAFYLNGTVFSVAENVMTSVYATGIKMQCFQNTPLAVNEAISTATVTGNVVSGCETGISLEKTSSSANDAQYVAITGNSVNGVGNGGYGIYVTDSAGTVVADNTINGGAYGIAALVTTSGRGISGRISNNRVANSRWSGIIGYAYEHLAIHGNTVIRPCLAAVASEPQQSAIYAYSSSTTHRVEVSNNSLITDTSTGVVNGLSCANVDAWIGDNDLEAKPIATSGTTIRKRTMFGDYTGLALWSSIGTVANGATLTKTVTVTGAVSADQVVSLSLASDLQGCTLSGYMTANTLNVVLTNNTGSSKTISDAFLRYSVMRFAA